MNLRRKAVSLRLRARCPAEVYDGLLALRGEFPDCRRRLESFFIYADVGKDRAKLTMEWVDKAREACEDDREFQRLLSGFGK